MNVIVSGEPGVGKTTICRMIMERADGNVRGFVTEDIRHEGERVGFMVEFDNGASRVLSHVDFDGPPVGKYGVDMETMEWVVERMKDWEYDTPDLLVVDEIGKMELKEEEFAELVEECLDTDADLLATAPKVGPDFVGDVRARDDVTKLELTEDNREDVLRELVDLFTIQPESSA